MRDLFLLEPNIIFLNHGSFGATPLPVFNAYQEWQVKLERQPVLFLGRELQGYLKDARNILAKYLNANPDDLVYIPNATFGVNIIARSLNLCQDDEVLVSNHEYGACERTWKFICQKTGAKYLKQPINLPASDYQEPLEQLWQGVTERTKLIFISHFSSPTAQIFPVEKICDRARQHGILTMVDGAHAPGQITVDLEAIGADFYTGNCHKWMMAPKGSAFLHVCQEKQKFIEPLIISWGWQAESTYTSGSQYLDYLQIWGTTDPAAWLSVPAAIQFQKDYHWEDVRLRCTKMIREAVIKVSEITELEPLYPDSDGFTRQMAALPLPEYVDVQILKDFLYDKAQIEIPCYLWEEQPYARISIQGYNSAEEINHFLSAIRLFLEQAKPNS